ncbi:MAG: undecaprenyl-phosphate glucose phosphotransferase [Anaerolineae bacterium]
MARNSSTVSISDKPVTLKNPRNEQWVKLFLAVLLFISDGISLVGAFVVGYYARLYLPFFLIPDIQPPLINYIPTMILHVGLIVAIFYFNQLYHLRRTFSRFDQARRIIGIASLGAVLVYGVQELVFRNTLLYENYPRSMFVYVWFFSVIFAVLGRELHRLLQVRLRMQGIATDNLLIVGTGRIARDIIGKITNRPSLGYNIVGVVTSAEEHQGRMVGYPIIGNFPDLPAIIDTYHVQQIIIALPDAHRSELVELVTLCQRGSVDIKIYPDIFAYMAGDMNVDDLGGTPLLTVRDIALRGWKLSLKRGLDLFGSMIGLIVLSPWMLLTALLLYLEDGGPPFYTQERMGLDGRPFPMVKFRSMRVDADQIADWTVENDPRVTRIGRFMRRTNWDEIPQLINVLLGHMSLVGPRPEQPQYVIQFRDQIPDYMSRHREKGGMTGWAQVNGMRGDTSIARRTTFDLWYIENWSLWLDIKIILSTIIQTISGNNRNAY